MVARAHVYIRITMATAHVPPCGKVSPVNIANGGQTDITFSSAGGIPLIYFNCYLQLSHHQACVKINHIHVTVSLDKSFNHIHVIVSLDTSFKQVVSIIRIKKC